MGGLHNQCVAKYVIHGRKVEVDLCWQGDDPESDGDRFYDLYDEKGFCLNEGEPWHDDGRGVPTKEEIEDAFSHWKTEAENG